MTMFDLSRCSVAKSIASLVALAASTFGLSSVARAETTIRHPGQHTQYSFELEPHLTIDWFNAHYAGEGIGPGVHFAIPLMHQGPISTINNNMAIKFGLDVTFGNGCRYWANRFYNDRGCDATSFVLPIALQWNFYVTDIIVPFGEAGLAIGHSRYSYDGPCANGLTCNWHDSDTYPLMYFVGGAKFMFGRNAGLTVRMGYPHITVGASILF